MPQKTGLEELKELAKPALRHAELVILARTETPSKVFDIVSSRWPRRQAKAAKALAIMRRDFGPEAFEAFVTAMERVRSEQPETEQAQEARQMNDRIRNALERISDPHKKLEIMVNNGLLVEATAFLYETVNTMTAYFDWNRGSHNPHELFTTESDPTSPIDELKVGFHPADTNLAQDRLNIYQDSVFSLDFRGVIKALKWSDEETLRFMRHVLERMVGYPIHTHYFVWIVEGMQRAVRHFLQPEDDLARRAEHWMLLYRFRGGRLFELRERALPTPIEREHYHRERTTTESRQELNPIVDRMLELGMSETEVRDEFLNWLKDKFESGCGPEFVIAVAGAKCFKHDDHALEVLLREKYLPYMWEKLVEYNWLPQFIALGDLGLWKVKERRSNKPGDEQFFLTKLIELLARGKAGQVFQILVLLGDSLGIYSEEIRCMRDDFGKRPEILRAKKMMDVLAVAAFDEALKAEQYGMAVALAQHFDCYDEKQLERKADQAFVDEVAQIMGDHVRKNPEYLADVIKEGVATKDSDEETKANHTKLMAIRGKRDTKLQELKTARKKQTREVLQLAVDLDQPIRLEWMTFLASTHVR